MPFTDEQRQRAAEVRRQNREARLAAARPSAVIERPPDPEPQPDPEPDPEPDSGNVLAHLAGLFQQAAGQKAGRDKAITEALDVLGRLDPTKYPEIADNEQVQQFVERVQLARAQSTDVPPGTILGTGMAAFKKPWTKSDLMKGKDMPVEEARAKGYIEWVHFTPWSNFNVTWQGITIRWPAFTEGYFPKSHVDTYQESQRLQRYAENHAAWLFNTPNVPVDPSFFMTNAPRVKAMDQSHGEYYRPGGGEIDLRPSSDLVEMAGIATEEAT